MKIEMDVSGLVTLVRWWPKGTSPDQMLEHRDDLLSPVHLLGPVTSRGHDGHGTDEKKHDEEEKKDAERHRAVLSVPVASIDSWSAPPMVVVDSPNGQIAIFDIEGYELTVNDQVHGNVGVPADTEPCETGNGVEFDDEHRSGKGSVNVAFKDWSDIMWLPDLSLIGPATRELHSDLGFDSQPAQIAPLVSFRIKLCDGRLHVGKPRVSSAQKAKFHFTDGEGPGNANYKQSFSDRVTWKGSSQSFAIELTSLADGKKHQIVLAADAALSVAHLPTPPTVQQSQAVEHFASYYTLLQPGNYREPLPTKVKSQPARGYGDAVIGIEPVFCLMSMINQALP